MIRPIHAGVLDVAYREAGVPAGVPVILLHGFPYDVHAYDDAERELAAAGCRVLTPYLRGYGPTRFRSPDTPRSGQQAALAHDLLAFMDALALPRAVLAGFDWGGRAACIVAALWPHRVSGLVSCGGYNIQNIAAAGRPQAPAHEYQYWYQYYFHSERGRLGLSENRAEFCRLLWTLWSPTWDFDDALYAQTAAAFENPDFVDVVIHSYRHRFGLVAGDPALEDSERLLANQPDISVPSIVLDGGADGIPALGSPAEHARHFTGFFERRLLENVGHNPPQEAPVAFADAVLGVIAAAGQKPEPGPA
ncbi:alpha/beta fold hydrolase [Salinisphaera aquimarina]|uniref:Alpha/beta fold hydrolase n=1 Tax=Salinisphaera aquimarina TaxID=2094031 RepID=A0ABV7ELE1_9GAMM